MEVSHMQHFLAVGQIKVNYIAIQWNASIKYLGEWFDRKLILDLHIKTTN